MWVKIGRIHWQLQGVTSRWFWHICELRSNG